MRQLATIQRIKNITPIEGADSIETAKVLGWQVVVEKGKHAENDLVVFCEIDSVLPDDPKRYPEFQFMKERKFRIRTIRLRKQISQGICFPISIMEGKRHHEIKEGEDVTETLGILKYVPHIPACLVGKVKGSFPDFIPKTDETRVQVLQNVLTRHKGKLCYITEKMDGASATYYIKNGVFGVCSRNLELLEDEDNMFWKMARELKIKEKLENFRKNHGIEIAIQGELIGIGIQKNPLKLDKNTVLFFNVFFIDNFKYADFHDCMDILRTLGLETVPVIREDFALIDNIDELIKMATGKSKLTPLLNREGIVIRPLHEETDLEMSIGLSNARLTMKAVNPEYLLLNDG